MSAVVVVVSATLAAVLGALAGSWLPPNRRRASRNRPRPVRRILLPFTGQAISRRAFEASVRLAKAQNAVVIPALLTRVPMNLPVDTALPVQCATGMPLLEAIEQSLTSQGVAVDSRVGRGRSARDALRKLLKQESFDRIVSAEDNQRDGLGYDDLRWLLERVPAEVMILRPAPQDTRRISVEEVSGHF
ncbi:MAG TPA: universal stress protein [Solirubrobacteraceae bacterium]|jgi:hypothetical protein|nr:universal stress protein [Solirubrobacteraceae bacterium]